MYSSFEDLDVYKAAIKFTGEIYRLLEKDPLKRDFCNGRPTKKGDYFNIE